MPLPNVKLTFARKWNNTWSLPTKVNKWYLGETSGKNSKFMFHDLYKLWHDMTTNILSSEGRRDHDRMVVGFTATYAISAYYH
jgi:hypothetical protein